MSLIFRYVQRGKLKKTKILKNNQSNNQIIKNRKRMTRWWTQYTHKGTYKDTPRIKCNLCTQHNGWLDGSNYYKAANNHYNKFHSELKPDGISNTGTIIGTVSENVANRGKRKNVNPGGFKMEASPSNTGPEHGKSGSTNGSLKNGLLSFSKYRTNSANGLPSLLNSSHFSSSLSHPTPLSSGNNPLMNLQLDNLTNLSMNLTPGLASLLGSGNEQNRLLKIMENGKKNENSLQLGV